MARDGRGKGKLANVQKRQINELEKVVDRPNFIAFCRRQSDPRFQQMADIMVSSGSPTQRSFFSVAYDVGLRYEDICQAYVRDRQTAGLVMQAAHLPEVMEHIAVDSKSREDTCTECDGTGRLEAKGEEDGKLCKTCGGKGKIRVLGDAKSRDLLMRGQGLIQDKGVTVTTNVQSVNVPSLSSLVGAASKALAPKVIPAELVEETS